MARPLFPHSATTVNVLQFVGKAVYGGIVGSILALASPVAAQQSPSTHTTRAVVELFTSQGCAACPPADTLMCDYAQDSGVVVLTMPVTCWDYLGWRDTLANEKFTQRQRIYAKLRGERRIYTPQAVINGDTHLLGSDANAMQKALAPITSTSSTVSGSALPLAVDIISDGDHFSITITPSLVRSKEDATIVLAPFYRAQTVTIEGGENEGRKLSYVNVVRDLVPLGTLPTAHSPHTPITLSLLNTDAMPEDTNGFAILVQSGSTTAPGRMLGAAAFVSAGAQALPAH